MRKKLFTQQQEEEIFILSKATRWDYLASEFFNNRNRIILAKIQQHMNKNITSKVLEIGGNPNPLVADLIKANRNISGTIIDPYVSPIAKDKYDFLLKNNTKVYQSLNQVTDQTYDLVIFLGVDLSLSDSYSDLQKDLKTITEIVSRARMVITETPEYQPSRWLERIITSNLLKVDSKEIHVDAKNQFSISEEILNRRMSVWENQFSSTPKIDNLEHLLQLYAKWHGMSGAPKINTESMHLAESAYGVQLVFNTWQIENSTDGTSFTWLKRDQKILFPKKMRNLQIDFLHGIPPTNHSTFWYTCVVRESSIVITRKFSRKVTVKFPVFRPSSRNSQSTDHRSLAIAATRYRFY